MGFSDFYKNLFIIGFCTNNIWIGVVGIKMRDSELGKKKARIFYDEKSRDYSRIYKHQYEYPASVIRLNIVLRRLKKNKARTILDVGCGTCIPMIKLIKGGFKVKGFDFSRKMVEEGKKELERNGINPNLIFEADIEKFSLKEKFDAVIVLGVFPHIVNEDKAFSNLRKMLKKEGLVFIEFRNDLFASYTLNEYSFDFFLNRVIDLESLPKKTLDKVIKFYSEKFGVSMTNKRKIRGITHNEFLSKFHNPLCINKLFERNGFDVVKIHFYHYHALPPIFEKECPKLFKRLSLKMENPDDWKGYLMASAFVVEAKKK